MLVDPEAQWKLGSVEGRWSGLGPYYAMFPVSFARKAIEAYSNPGDTVIDPFCGRGTTNYVAQTLGRHSVGCEINPVGWIYAKVKTGPASNPTLLYKRIDELAGLQTSDDREAENDFQEWAWCPDVLGFLNCARRNLRWKTSTIDRTIAAFLLVYLHAKVGGGLSNQMRQSKSLAPDYSVRWWKARSLRPPQIDPVKFLKGRIEWRYAKGKPEAESDTKIYLGDARETLPRGKYKPASMILTSPPYMGITNYQYDNWIRLWALGGPSLPDWSLRHRHANRERYGELLRDVFSLLKRKSSGDVRIVVRTDSRRYTLEKTAEVMFETWPEHRLYGQHSVAKKPTQTALFGDKTVKPGEVDLIALPSAMQSPPGYVDIIDY